MKRPTLFLTLFVGLLVLFTLGGFGSLANSNKTQSRGPGSTSGREPFKIESQRDSDAETAKQSDDDEGEDEDSDPDLGKFKREIDREEYLKLRDEYVARKRGIEPGRPFDPRARGRAIQQMQQRESALSGKNSFFGSVANLLGFDLNVGAAWTSIGPAPLFPNGSGNPTQAFTGRVTAIVVDPTNPNIVYLGAAQGGVWRSTNAGLTWTAIFDDAQSLAIGALALAPSDHTLLYVGTGEFNGCGDCFFGAGLYRVENADTTATLVGPINPSMTIGNLTYNIFNGRSISKILVHPTDPNTIFVSTGSGVGGSGNNALGGLPPMATRGVYRSTNAKAAAGSVAFQKLVVNTDNSFDSPPTGNVTISDMVIEPGVPDNLLVGVIGQAQSGGIYRSTNALSGTPTFVQALSLGAGTRVSLAINKLGGTVTAYAGTSETPNVSTTCTTTNSGAVRKSTDGGATWSDQLAGGQGYCNTQCFYDMPIAVSPNDPNLVFIGGQATTTVPVPGQPSVVCGRLVGKSTDGGNTFANDGSGLHADEHAFFFDTIGNIYTGNDGGVWKRALSAATGTLWTNLNQSPLSTLSTLQFESVAVHPVDQFFTIGGTQDNGTEAQQNSSGNWKNAEGGDGGYTLIDQGATNTSSVTMYLTFFNRSNTQIMFDRATLGSCLNTINSWPTRGTFACGNPSMPCADVNTPVSGCDSLPSFKNNGIQLTDNVLFYAPMALGPGTPNTVYFGTDRLYRSTDMGDNMTIVGGTTTAPLVPTSTRTPLGGGAAVSVGFPISSIAISPQDDNYRIVGLQNGGTWATSTGSSLIEIQNTFPANPNGSTNRFVGRAMIDPNNKNVAYIALSYFAPAGQGVWKITNLGAAAGSSPVAPNWTVAGNGIPSIPINAFAIDPLNSNSLFAGTDIGVYNSTDGGANWFPYGTGLPRVAVFDMKIQNTSRILRVATHGRGMWEIAIGSAATPTPTPTPIAYSVSGRVADAANNSIGGVSVLFEMNFQGTMTTRTVQTDSNGNFNSGDVGCQNNVKVTPSKTAYTFSPLAMSFVNSGGCLTGSGTANFTASLQGPTIFVEEGTANQAVALDSVTLLRGPFRILTDHNFSADHHTRVILFTSDLGLSPNVTVTANGTSLTVENVGALGVAGLGVSSYIIVRLPDGLPAGNLPLIVTLNGAASSNSPTLAISP